MKLSELYKTEYKDDETADEFDYQGDARTSEKLRAKAILGSRAGSEFATSNKSETGWFSSVAPKDDFEVTKKSHMAMSAVDPYYYFALAVSASPSMKTNPHLPRIYAVKNTTDRNASSKQEYDIEKLINASDALTPESLNALTDRLFGDGEDDVIYNTYARPADSQRRVMEIFEAIVRRLASAFYSGDTSTIRDESMADAIKFVRGVFNGINSKGADTEWDLHSGNFMFRRTPHGLQLVITDPFKSRAAIGEVGNRRRQYVPKHERVGI